MGLLVLLSSIFGNTALAEEIPTNYIEAMLLTTVSENRGEFGAVGYDMSGEKRTGDMWKVNVLNAIRSEFSCAKVGLLRSGMRQL